MSDDSILCIRMTSRTETLRRLMHHSYHQVKSCRHGRGNDFLVGGAKIGEKQSRQSNSKCNSMQYVFFKKGIDLCAVECCLGQSPQKLGSFREFLC